VDWLEQEIDRVNAQLQPLKSFVLPGGSAASAHLHMARTVVRRAERDVSFLASEEEINVEAVRYLNRLSDLLFVLARHVNANGDGDVLWKPGANR
jgi:cob(I)alamin adenosyltransferase